MPFSNDSLFPGGRLRAGSRQLIAGSELRVIESPWGHWAWEMTDPPPARLDDRHLRELLAAPAGASLQHVSAFVRRVRALLAT